MKLYKILRTKVILILFLATKIVCAQSITEAASLPQVIPPSPTVSNLMAFEEVPVDLYSGQPDISVPLYSKKLSSELSLPLTLKYSTTGVKINQKSGWVGTGWSLDAGGTVSRTVRGVADEKKKIQGYDNPTGLYYINDFWNFDNLTPAQRHEYLWNVNGTSKEILDSEPDLYQFSVLGHSGRFIIIKEGGTLKAKLLSKEHKYNIQVFYNSDFIIHGFIITDGFGYNYVFGNTSPTSDNPVEVTTSTPVSIIYPRGGAPASPPSTLTRDIVSNTAWHLTQITTDNGSELANFEYTESLEEYQSLWATTEYTFDNPLSMSQAKKNNEYNISQFKPEKVQSYSNISVLTRKLRTINFPDNTSYSFTHTTQGTHPEHSGLYLDRVDLVDPLGNTVNYYTLQYAMVGYDDSALSEPYRPKRLWLVGVNGGSGRKYVMYYTDKEKFPEYTSSSDPWGYKTINETSNYDITQHNTGVLEALKFPTGGAKEFVFEPNTFSYRGSDYIGNFDSNPLNNQYSWIHFPQFTASYYFESSSYNFDISHPQQVIIEKSAPTGQGDQFAVWLKKTTDTEWQTIPLSELTKTITLSAGTYTFKVRADLNVTVGASTSVNIHLRRNVLVSESSGLYSNFFVGGGLRIKEVRFKDHITDIESKKTIYYRYNQPNDPNIGLGPVSGSITSFRGGTSSGAVDSREGRLFNDYVIAERKYLFETDENVVESLHINNILYQVKKREINVPLTKGNYVGYKYVTVGGLQNGYTQHTYSTPQDHPSPAEAFYYPFLPPPNRDYLRGLLLNKIIFNNEKKKLEEIINSYDYNKAKDTVGYSVKVWPNQCEWRQFYEYYDEYVANQPDYPAICTYGAEQADCFGAYSHCEWPHHYAKIDMEVSWAPLVQTVKRKYFYNGSSGNTILSTTNYTYNEDNYQLKSEALTITEGSSTNQYKTDYEYAIGGYSTSLFPDTDEQDAIASMENRNIINKPIVITTSKNSTVLQRVINKYAEFPDNLVLPKIIATYKANSGGTITDKIIFSKYNSFGNVLEASKTNGKPIVYIWAYNGTVPVAKLEGVNYDNIPVNLINLVHDSTTESTLRTALNTLHIHYASNNFVQVTTFLHDPSKNVVLEVKDPRGYLMKYSYDILARLEAVKDENGKLLSENEYYYRP